MNCRCLPRVLCFQYSGGSSRWRHQNRFLFSVLYLFYDCSDHSCFTFSGIAVNDCNLSKGYKQRVGIAQALVGNPDVLILDEPTVGLDPQQIIEIRNLISQLGRSHTVILSSHILSEIQAVCERVIIINQGYQIADDTATGLSQRVSDDHSIMVRLIAPPREAKTMLESIPGVELVQITGIHGNASEFKIDPTDVEAVTKEIAERAMNKRWPIVGLYNKTLTLEDIYIRLVNDDPAKLSAQLKGEDVEQETQTSVELAEEEE